MGTQYRDHGFARLEALLGKRDEVNATNARNTRIRRIDPDTIAVRYHFTDVVIARRDGSYTIHDGGYRTTTTKERIKRFAPVRLYQSNHEWKIDTPDGSIPFRSGMVVNANGIPEVLISQGY